MSYIRLSFFCFFIGSAASMSIDQIDVKAIKGSRDVVPAEEILEIIKPFLKPKSGLLQGLHHDSNNSAVLGLISNLGFSASSTGKSFTIPMNKAGTWIEAWSNCITGRRRFATIDSAAEQLQIIQLMFTQGISSSYVWLAGIDITSGGVFSWVGGSCGVPMSYTNWLSGAPNNVNGDEHCLATSIAGWDDLSCTFNSYYVCE